MNYIIGIIAKWPILLINHMRLNDQSWDALRLRVHEVQGVHAAIDFRSRGCERDYDVGACEERAESSHNINVQTGRVAVKARPENFDFGEWKCDRQSV